MAIHDKSPLKIANQSQLSRRKIKTNDIPRIKTGKNHEVS